MFRHAGIVERWDLRPEGAEQSFVLQERPTGNVLAIEITTDLRFAGADQKGLHFAAEGWGEVVYGNAVAIELDGDRFDLRTTFAAGTIRIELPAGASYPLVVDPFVSTIGVASNEVADNRNPDVAYDADSDRWCVAMEERVSAFDTDIKVRRFSASGTLLDTDFFETSGAVADQPAVAAARSAVPGSGQFCVVWREGSLSIIARRVDAVAATPTSPVTLFLGSIGLTWFYQRPDIAGSQVGTYLAVTEFESPVMPPSVDCKKISLDGSVQPFTVSLSTTGCITPHVAAAMPPDHEWPVAWNRQASGCLGGDVHLAVVNQSLGLELQPTPIATAAFDDDRHVDVAWNGSKGIVVWDRDQGSHHDIMGQAFQRTASGYSLLAVNRNLTLLEPGITVSADQQKPVIATDGVRFAVAYMEGATPKPICATFAVDGGFIECHEGHVLIATAPLNHDDMGIAAMGTSGGALTRYFVVTDERDGNNDYDVQGLFYDGRQPGTSFTTVDTGCVPFHFTEPELAATGGTVLGESFTLTMTGHRAPSVRVFASTAGPRGSYVATTSTFGSGSPRGPHATFDRARGCLRENGPADEEQGDAMDVHTFLRLLGRRRARGRSGARVSAGTRRPAGQAANTEFPNPPPVEVASGPSSPPPSTDALCPFAQSLPPHSRCWSVSAPR